MAAGTPEDPIIKIIYKKKKGKGHGHHGGAWKVAFADFMTAMMALFLVLWIMAQSQEVKQAVASYFRHPTDYEGKADAILRGNMGLMNHKSGRLDTTPNILSSPGSGTNNEVRSGEAASAETVAGAAASVSAEQGLRPALVERLAEQEVDDIRTFIDIADNLWQNLGMDPSFMRVKEQLQIETHEDGLVVQIIERPDYPLFEPHTNLFRSEIVRTFEILAKGLKGLPNKLEIDGHGPGLSKDRQSMWLGSAHLADLARGELEKAGIGAFQITKIAGCANRRPLSTQNPLDGVNRRISILVRPRQWQPERY